jgi:MinD-like ATPase involved in chromosome partitioning or flagellar assembly
VGGAWPAAGAAGVGEWGARPVALGRPGPVRFAVAEAAVAPMRDAGVSVRVGDRLRPLVRGRGAAASRARLLAGLPLWTQRIVVVSVAGGVGRSVVAAGVGLALAAHRSWPVAVVDAADLPFGGLAGRLGAPGGPTLADVWDVLGRVRAGTDLAGHVRVVAAGGPLGKRRRTGAGGQAMEVAGHGVHLFAGSDVGQRPVDAGGLGLVLSRLGELYPTVVVDAPAGLSGPWQVSGLAGAAAVVVVTRARAEEIRRTAAGLVALRRCVPVVAGVPVVGVVVAAGRGRWGRAAAAAEPVLGALCAWVVRLRWDAALAGGAAVSAAAGAVAVAMEEIAALALAVAVPAAPGGKG